MPTISPATMRTIARTLIDDGRASGNDGEILTRFVEMGSTTRVGLDAAIDEIENSDLEPDKKKVALKRLETFMGETASGLEAEFFSAPVALMERLQRMGIDSTAKLLEAGATFSQREHLGAELGISEKQVRGLVKQADLLRVDGIDGKIARVLLESGIDSVPELANRNPERLLAKLQKFGKTREAYIMGFKLPQQGTGSAAEQQLNALKSWRNQARGLDRAVEFGRPGSGFENLSIEQRVDVLFGDIGSYSTDSFRGSAAEFFDSIGEPQMKGAIGPLHECAMDSLSYELGYWDIDISPEKLADLGSYDALLNHVSSEEADRLGNGYADFEPEIEVIRDNNKVVGARITYGNCLDGDHGYYATSIYDNVEKRFTASIVHGYEIDDERDILGPDSPDSWSPSAQLCAKLDQLLPGLSSNGEKWESVLSEMDGDLTADNFRKATWRESSVPVEIKAADASVLDQLASRTDGDFGEVVDFLQANCTDLKLVETSGWQQRGTMSYLVGKDPDGLMMGVCLKG